jgi:ribonuclease E
MRLCKGCTRPNSVGGKCVAPWLNVEDRNASSEVAVEGIIETIITIAEEVGRTNRTGDTKIDGIEMITEEESTETTIEETTFIEIETETTTEGTTVTMIVEDTTLDTVIVGTIEGTIIEETIIEETIIEETIIEETITAAMDTEIVDTEIVDTSAVDTTSDAATTEIVPVLTSVIPSRHLLEISQR